MLREDLLIDAATAGNLRQVKAFLDTGVDVNSTDMVSFSLVAFLKGRFPPFCCGCNFEISRGFFVALFGGRVYWH